MDADLDTLVTALYVKIDDRLVKDRHPGHPVRLSQSELVCLAVAQALLGFHSEHRWIRFAICHLRAMFPYLPHQPGYNKRLRAALPLVKQVIRDLATDSDFWLDDVWIADSTPVECARSRPAVRRSDMAGWANYGYCASHSRWFWGLRLYMICTPAGMPVMWALADTKIGEREVLAAMLDIEPQLAVCLARLTLITTRASPDTRRRPGWSPAASPCCAHPAKTNRHGTAKPCSRQSASSSNRSTTPSRASSTSKPTAAVPSRASPSGLPSASWRWPPRSGTTTTPASPSPAP